MFHGIFYAYIHFTMAFISLLHQKKKDLQMKKQPTHATDVNDNEVPCANSGGGREETNQQASPFIQQADTTFDTANLGKEYQTSVHFKVRKIITNRTF